MKFVYSPKYEVNIGPHVFPTSKYRLVKEKLIAEGAATEGDFLEPPRATREEILLVHTHELLDDLDDLRWTPRTASSELPISGPIVQAYMIAAGGSILAARTAINSKEKLCVHIGGGFHHAFANHAEGFCYINDIAVAIEVMQREKQIRRALVIDCDLHQGNGTAHIFENNEDVFTISIHQENNYPVKQQSDFDIGLDDFAGDEEYLAALEDVYTRALRSHKPELIVYVAGADPYEHDKLGGLKITKEGLSRRDEFVLSEAKKQKIPAIVVFAGGYAEQLEDTVEIHTQTCRIARTLCSR